MGLPGRNVCHACAGYPRSQCCPICDFPETDELSALREERDQWRQMVGRICSTIPVSDVLASIGTIQESVDYFKSLHKRLTAAEQRNAELADISDELLAAYESTIHSAYCQVNPDNDLIDRAMATLKPTESGASE